ncbi:unnamed protein product [Vitrella brassicaformis CCMP3155]|uniref:Amidohydrolase-related domain-containing protein n=2 Tax=Vitrella brassicaformis TaxID=1169539 RepID=A0A0G4GP74_VITBC|nr:unnamed protein product [Vitrella brassicaformis CCMP3155]|mmetsp:Transcript_11173/g.27044  ORF Transcript_11173/g.27044 Transcript_11173/m.27044 type:complete len:479 (+) Transcript_11173:23-1459(+)|eukprot:CEM32085.1 unnamed protein product [Vitrella brassicaformis CCMP3155]
MPNHRGMNGIASPEQTAGKSSSEGTDHDTAILARWVIPVDSDTPRVLERHAVCIKGERIAAIVPNDDVGKTHTARRVVDHSDTHALIPGLINCHAHTGMTMLRGYSDDQELQVWLHKFIWPAEGKFCSPDFVKYGTELAAYEMLKTGTTLVNDMYFIPDVSAEVFRRAKLRAVLGEAVIDFKTGKVKEMVDGSIDFIRREKAKNDPWITPSVVTHSSYTVGEEWHAALARANNSELQVPFHTHLHETEKEVADYHTQHGISAIDSLDRAGVLNERLVAAHCVWLTDEEIDKLAERGVNVCHNPKSNLKLASGVCDVVKLLRRGVNVCLGTDSSCSNNALNMMSEMQLASLLAKMKANSAAALDDFTALRLATINGARALGKADVLGSLEVGKYADVVAVDLSADELLPIYDPISHLVYTTARKVTDVWIGGHHVVDGGHVTTVQVEKEQIKLFAEKIREFKAEILAKDAQEADKAKGG